MDKNHNIEISQCMIVKNEEHNIENALSWGKGIVCEQIVVDTGSSDRTVEIALSLGARVYEFSWIDDFAAAKNYAISKARGQWIVFLDADEVMVSGDDEKLVSILEQLQATDYAGVSTGWMQLNDQGEIAIAGTQIRIFKNIPGLCYRRRIHEQLGWNDNSIMKVADATQILTILHSGYRGDAWKEKKVSQRNLKLILKELEDQPNDHEMMGYLGDEYYAADNMETARYWYKKSIEAMPAVIDNADQRSAATFLHYIEIVSLDKSEKQIEQIYENAVNHLPEEPDFDFILGRIYLSEKSYNKGIIFMERALAKMEQYGTLNRAMLLEANLQQTYEELALCCLMAGDYSKAVSYSIAVLKSCRYSASALHTLLKAFKGENEASFVNLNELVDFFKKLYDYNAKKDCLFVLRISDKAGFTELKQYMEGMFTEEELSCIKASWGRDN